MRKKIGIKLSLGFGLIIVLMVTTSCVTFINVRTMNRTVDDVVGKAFPLRTSYDRLRMAVNRQLSLLHRYLLLGADPERGDQLKRDREADVAEIRRLLAELSRFSQSGEMASNAVDMDSLTSTTDQFLDLLQRIENVAHTPRNIPAFDILQTEGVPLSNEILAALAALISEEVTLDASQERRPLMKCTADSRAAFASALDQLRACMLTGDPKYRQSFEQAWTANQNAYEALTKLEDMWTPSQRQQWQQYGSKRDAFLTMARKVFALREAPDWNQAQFLMASEALPMMGKIGTLLDELTSGADGYMRARRAEMETASRTLLSTLTVVTLVTVGVASVIAFLLSRHIATVTRRLADRVREVGEGNLTGEAMIVKSVDELGQLAVGFDDMVARLRGLTTRVLSATKNVNAAAVQISASSRQQAASTREQAATVQEITSTMQELSQTGKQIVDKAREVAAAAESTAQSSRSGIDAVRQTTSSMQAIREQVEEMAENIVVMSEKTQAVGEIISTVTDLAEQSNLLALNATIEAADAGDDGNRFSVVASEMKNLADQAKECTIQVRTILGEIQKGIHTAVMLTEEAVKRVEMGRQHAEASEASIRTMVDTTEQSVRAFQQIIAATNQQQVGFEQVARGMKDIEQATQQTASGTAELEQAAVSLSTLSEELATAIGGYRV